MTQNAAILKHLLDGKSLTTMKAFTRFKITNLQGRVFELRERGVPIDFEWVQTETARFKKYFIKPNKS